MFEQMTDRTSQHTWNFRAIIHILHIVRARNAKYKFCLSEIETVDGTRIQLQKFEVRCKAEHFFRAIFCESITTCRWQTESLRVGTEIYKPQKKFGNKVNNYSKTFCSDIKPEFLDFLSALL